MIPALGAGLVRLRGEGMIAVPGRRRRRPGQGIRSLADVPTDRFAKVLHLCRYPDKCCKVCGRYRARCRRHRHVDVPESVVA